MNLEKGFNRLFLVLAFCSIPFGYNLGYNLYLNYKEVIWDIDPSYNGVIINKFGVHVLPVKEPSFEKEISQEDIQKFNIPVPKKWRAYPRGTALGGVTSIYFLPPSFHFIIPGIITSIITFVLFYYLLKVIFVIIKWVVVGFKV